MAIRTLVTGKTTTEASIASLKKQELVHIAGVNRLRALAQQADDSASVAQPGDSPQSMPGHCPVFSVPFRRLPTSQTILLDPVSGQTVTVI